MVVNNGFSNDDDDGKEGENNGGGQDPKFMEEEEFQGEEKDSGMENGTQRVKEPNAEMYQFRTRVSWFCIGVLR